MAVNPNIALSFRPPQFESPINMLAQAQQIQGAQQVNQMREMEMRNAQEDRAQANALAQFMAGYQPGVTDDRGVLAFGRPGQQAYAALGAGAKARAEAKAAEEKARAEVAAKNTKLLRDMLPSVTPDTFPAWQQAAKSMLPEFAQMFDGEFSPQRVQQLMSTADQFLAQAAERAKVQAIPANATMLQDGKVIGQAAPVPQAPARPFAVGGAVYMPDGSFRTPPRAAGGGGGGGAAGGGAVGPGGRKAPANYQWKADGSGLEPIPGGPADPATKGGGKAATAAAAVEEGRASLLDQTASLQALYSRLNEIGGMTNTQRGAIANAATRAMSSAPGMLAGSFNPGETQVLRENIKNARPMLLQSIKQATGLTSGQLNSNVELQLWLNSVTDPTQPFETAQYTLQNLDKILVTDPAARAAAWRQIKQGPQGASASGTIRPPAAGGAGAPVVPVPTPSAARGGATPPPAPPPAANDPLGLRR